MRPSRASFEQTKRASTWERISSGNGRVAEERAVETGPKIAMPIFPRLGRVIRVDTGILKFTAASEGFPWGVVLGGPTSAKG